MSNDEFEFLTGQPGNNHKSSADNEFDRTDMVHISSNIPPSYNDVGLASSGPSKSDFFKRPNDKQHSLWVHCLCVVTFDIEFGQCVESIYPENALNEQERLALSYSSFPDSNSCINDEAQYYFRTKVSSPNCSMSSSFEKFNASSPPAIHVDKDVAYGFVYFLQKRDRTAKRGYFQKSLLIISRLPFVKLFNHFVTEIGIKFFSESQTDDDIITLENIYHEFNQWPPLVTGTPLILSILNTSVSFYIPSREDKLINFQPRPKNKSPGPKFAHPMPLVPPSTCLTAYDMNLYSCFESVISDLQLLWEMVLTCEPLIIMAPTPKMCSEFVQGLVSLIWPYKCYDYRPFFTIHDGDFREYVGRKTLTPNVILGVTNPFFAKSLDHWPNVIRLAVKEKTENHSQPKPFTLTDKIKFNNASSSWIVGSEESTRPLFRHSCRSFLQKDKNFLASILKYDRPSNVQTTMIRRWLVELTQSFFMPLERYLATLMPAHRKISPFKMPPSLPKFEPEAFLATLDISGPQLTTTIKGNWVGLYKKFFCSQNFMVWYQDRQTEIDRILKILHLESIINTGFDDWIKDRDEIETVDMIIFLRDRLYQAIEGRLNLTDVSMKELESKLRDLIELLPADLQPAFSKNLSDFEKIMQQ